MKILNIIKKMSSANPSETGHDFVGSIDQFTKTVLAGWIKKEGQATPLFIDVFIDEVEIMKDFPAAEYREDVKAAGFGSGRYGFQIDLSNFKEIIGPASQVSVKVSQTNFTALTAIYTAHYDAPANTAKNTNNDKDEKALSVSHFETLRPEYKIVADVVNSTEVRGWSISLSEPNKIFPVKIFIDGVYYHEVTNNVHERKDLVTHGISNGTGGFRLEVRLENLSPGEHVVSLIAPDGTSINKTIICGEPTGRETQFVQRTGQNGGKAINLWLTPEPFDLTVIIPIYNAADDLRVCIDRLAEFTPRWAKILLINDASTDAEIPKILKSTEHLENVKVVHNEKNLGFTRTINKGLEISGNSDVIILNSDARVTRGWVQGLRMAALSRPRVATVTAMSDRAGAFSAPKIGNENLLPTGVDEVTYARAFRRRSAGLYPSVPTGNGFCMYISRASIKEVGPLDAKAFPRGYGEENDFCMRAGRAGWTNLLDDRTYVFHDRSKSFKETKTSLMTVGREIIDRRYPEYKNAISIYSTDPSIVFARFRALQAIADCEKGRLEKSRVLYVVSTRTGGTPQTNQDLMGAIDDAVDGWVLRCDSSTLELSHLVEGEIKSIKQHTLTETVNPLSHRSNEYDSVVTDWLLNLDPDIVHIRHIGWHSLSLPKISRQLDIRTIFSFHDFYTLCPNVKLIDAESRFCGGVCTTGVNDCTVELWNENSMPRIRNEWVHIWREKFLQALKHCDAFITTSQSAKDRILSHFPILKERLFEVIPHGRDFCELEVVRRPYRGVGKFRILVPGNINEAKGLNIIESLVAHDKAGVLEFHILGDVSLRGRELHPSIIRHGTYSRNDFTARAAAIKPHIGAIFSIWDETFCHTLTELWSAGLPALAFDFPTVGGRVRDTGAGWVLDHTNIAELYNKILEISSDHAEMIQKASAVAVWQSGSAISNTTRVMGARYLQVYRRVIRPQAPKLTKVGVVCPQGNDLKDANASTHIRIWERSLNHINRDVSFIRLHSDSLFDLAERGEIHAAIIQRTAVSRIFVDRLCAKLSDRGIPFAVDVDDDLFDVSEEQDPTGFYRDYAPFLNKLIKNAKAVTVSTPELQKKIEALNSNSILLPNLLSNRLWLEEPAERKRDGVVRALYMGSKTHLDDLNMVLPALEDVAFKFPMFRLTLVGVADCMSEKLPDFVDVVTVPQEYRSYQRFVSWLRSNVANVDFGIAPLRDTPFNAKKSPLKVLEYGALGLPAIASDTVVYRDLGRVAPHVHLTNNTREDWALAVQGLLVKGSLNRCDGGELREWVLRNRMLHPSLPEFDEMLLDILK